MQRQMINSYAKQFQVEITREFRDEDPASTDEAVDRAGLMDLLIALRESAVRLVLVERADSLPQDLIISEIILDEFRKLGVNVIAVNSNRNLLTESDDPKRTLMRQILATIARWEKCALVHKLRTARAKIRETDGRCEGRKPYGTTDQEKWILSRIRTMRCEGKTIKSISEQLNFEGIKTRTARRAGQQTKWHPTTIQRILAGSYATGKQSKSTKFYRYATLTQAS